MEYILMLLHFRKNSLQKVYYIKIFKSKKLHYTMAITMEIFHFTESIKITRQESSMIHSASPLSRPVVQICFVFGSILKRLDGRTTCVNTVITTGRDWTSSWIN